MCNAFINFWECSRLRFQVRQVISETHLASCSHLLMAARVVSVNLNILYVSTQLLIGHNSSFHTTTTTSTRHDVKVPKFVRTGYGILTTKKSLSTGSSQEHQRRINVFLLFLCN